MSFRMSWEKSFHIFVISPPPPFRYLKGPTLPKIIISVQCCHSKDSRPLIVKEVVQWIVGRIRLPQAMIIDRAPNCGFLVRASLTFCTFFAFFAFFATLLYSKEPKYTNTPKVETSLILHPHYPKVSGLRFVLSGRLLDQHTKWTKWIPSDAMGDRKLFDFNLMAYFDRLNIIVCQQLATVAGSPLGWSWPVNSAHDDIAVTTLSFLRLSYLVTTLCRSYEIVTLLHILPNNPPLLRHNACCNPTTKQL